MTGLLEEAFRRVESLSVEEQNSIASLILDSLENEDGWERRFQKLPQSLLELADAAREEHRRGETRPLDELIS